MSSFSFPTEVVAEGKVEVVVPRLKAFVSKPSDYAPSKAPVFYNPVMELNRDLAVLAVQAFQRTIGDDVSICEPLAGCGVRGVRFAREVEGVEKVVVNDINREAYKLARFNVEKNGLAGSVSVDNEDANSLLSRFGAPKKRFAYVDIDPFGSPMPFVDSALRALRSGGLLALTATDLTSLCGVYPRVCVRRYCGMPLRTEYCHELAVRLLAGALAKAAARYDVGVDVAFSHSSEHYVRLYALVTSGAKKADASLGNMGFVHHCYACFHREVVVEMFQCRKICPECGEKMAVAGPLWLGRIVDYDFVASIETEARSRDFRGKRSIRRLLELIKGETDSHVTYYVVDAICDKLGLPVPSVKKVVERLEEAGFGACLTHFHPSGFRTDAPAKMIKEVIVGLV
ncbi:MAG: tRNA (guanine(10)-N(2))-dimethyltransferase [Candidatus Bathyarchaeota archaeon]|nr:tRNA (guanine(10)-N(2))-dimethyltransferase [Candidatus Bathyarchaeota archaeon]